MFHDDMVRDLDKKIDRVVEVRINLRALRYGEKMMMCEQLSKILQGKLSPDELAAAIYRWTNNGDTQEHHDHRDKV